MWMIALGRLKPGTAIGPAQSELTDLWRLMYAAKGADTGELTGNRAVVTPLRDVIFGPARPALIAVLAAGILVLLIACANVAGLLMVQATDRRRDMAVRHALGASRGRLVRTAFVDSLLIASLAGVGGLAAAADIRRLIFRHGLGLTALGLVSGLLAAAVGTRLIAAVLYEVPGQDPLTFIAAPLVLASAAGFACLIPALRATRVDPVCALRGE